MSIFKARRCTPIPSLLFEYVSLHEESPCLRYIDYNLRSDSIIYYNISHKPFYILIFTPAITMTDTTSIHKRYKVPAWTNVSFQMRSITLVTMNNNFFVTITLMSHYDNPVSIISFFSSFSFFFYSFDNQATQSMKLFLTHFDILKIFIVQDSIRSK